MTAHGVRNLKKFYKGGISKMKKVTRVTLKNGSVIDLDHEVLGDLMEMSNIGIVNLEVVLLPDVVVDAPPAPGATAYATISNGRVTSIVVNPGGGYLDSQS
jgi:hypothetical protein